MKELFRDEKRIPKSIINDASKEIIEKQIVMDFFNKLPIDALKKLVNFQEIDFKNLDLWANENLQELLCRLADINHVQYSCEIYLEI